MKKKVLFFIESLAGGGAEKVLTTLVKNLNKEVFDITVVTVVDTGIYVNDVKEHCNYKCLLPNIESISSIWGKVKYYLEYRWIYSQPVEKVYKKYIKDKYDIEIGFVEGFATKFISASNNPKSKKICWVHIDMEQNPYADIYYTSVDEEREVYKSYDKIIGVSKSVKSTFERKFSLPETVNVIYNPIDLGEILSKSNEKVVADNFSGLTLLSIGRLEYQKGYDRLINVLKELEEREIHYKFLILGEGSERTTLENEIRKNHLEEKVYLLGFQENPYKWMKLADAFVCTSRAEGYNLAIAEAMILNLPIFTLECAGPNEILEYGKYGVMVSNTYEDLKIMMTNLLTGKYDLDYYKNLSKQRKTFFELDSIIDEVERIFLE